jgi:hypothetical protein
MTPRVTASWDPTAVPERRRRGAPGFGVELEDHTVAARQRVEKALAAVGPELAGVLIDVCCHNRGLEETERSAGWPARTAKVVLQLALAGLARHYGITAPGGGAWTGRPGIRHWGAPDFRPKLDRWK